MRPRRRVKKDSAARVLLPSAQSAPRPGQLVIPYANELRAELAMLADTKFVSFSPLPEGPPDQHPGVSISLSSASTAISLSLPSQKGGMSRVILSPFAAIRSLQPMGPESGERAHPSSNRFSYAVTGNHVAVCQPGATSDRRVGCTTGFWSRQSWQTWVCAKCLGCRGVFARCQNETNG